MPGPESDRPEARRGASFASAPDKPPERTVVSVRRAQEHLERRQSMRRLILVGTIAWPFFVFADWIACHVVGRPEMIGRVTLLRAGGFALALAAYYIIAYAKRVDDRLLTALDLAIFLVGGTIISLQAVWLGGLTSPLGLGVLITAFARASLMPSHWARTFMVAGLTAMTFPLVMGAAAAFVPEIEAQWASPHALAEFAFQLLMTMAALLIGSLGSHLQWASRRQVLEARRLGNYRLKARIGTGGNGEVWLARQDPLNRSVALKVLKERGASDEETIRRFEREAQAASSLKHPNTIRIFDFGASDDGVLFIAMELLDGLDLDSLVAIAGPLPAARTIHFARQACGSLAEAHDAGIVHRDIKPANFFVARVGDDYDFLKLLDFGVARMLVQPRDASITETGIMFGTPAYMSPEVCNGSTADARSDIYSLGAVLYFMLTGTPLFPGRTFAEIVMAQVSRMPDPPSERLAATISEDLERVIMRCLAKDPKDRYASVRDVELALAACKDAAQWSRADARAWWTVVRPSAQLHAQGAA